MLRHLEKLIGRIKAVDLFTEQIPQNVKTNFAKFGNYRFCKYQFDCHQQRSLWKPYLSAAAYCCGYNDAIFRWDTKTEYIMMNNKSKYITVFTHSILYLITMELGASKITMNLGP